jgi:WD40 repeat protein
VRIALLIFLSLPVSLQAADDVKPITLDPLPKGAQVCLGSPRFVTEGAPSALAFSPDGKWLAIGTDPYFRGVSPEIQVREFATGKLISTLVGHKWKVGSLRFSADGKRLASYGDANTVRVWDVANAKEERKINMEQLVRFELSASGKEVITLDKTGKIQVWDIATGESIRQFGGKAQDANSISLAADGTVAVTEDQKLVRFWDISTGKQVGAFAEDGTGFQTAQCSPVGKSLALYESVHRTRLVDRETGEQLWKVEATGKRIWMTAFSPDGKLFATIEFDKDELELFFANAAVDIRLWDAKTGKAIRSWSGHSKYPTCVTFSPDSKSLLTGSIDNSVRVWDVATGKEDPRFTGHAAGILAIVFSPDGKTLYSSGQDGKIRVWDTVKGVELAVLRSHVDWVKALSVTPDGKVLASSGNEGIIRLWDTETRKEIKTLTDGGRVEALAFSPDGKTLASGSQFMYRAEFRNTISGTARSWDWQAGKDLRIFHEAPDGESIAFSQDGKQLAAGSGFRLYVWDYETGKVRVDGKDVHGDRMRVGGFLADGTVVTVGAVESSTLQPPPAVRVWDLDGKKQHEIPFKKRMGVPFAIAVSSDGKRFASAHGAAIEVRDSATRREVATFAGHPYSTSVLAFSPDGKILASGGADGAIILWKLPQ